MIEMVSRDWFYQLASDLQEERVKATIGLVSELSELARDSKEWEYVLNRLIKGLSSSRNGARLGYSLCLTEVVSLALEKGSISSINEYTELLQSALFKESVKNGKEERGLLFGKMFGFQALLNEPLFSKIFKTSSGDLNLEFTIQFMDFLIQTALQKSWIREPCFYTLYQALEKLSPLFNSWNSIESILKLLDSRGLTLTNEGLALYIYLIHVCHDTKSVLSKDECLENLSLNSPWKHNDPLVKGNLPMISEVLKDSLPVEDNSLKQKGTWAPRLHFVWDMILPVLTQRIVEEEPVHVSKKRKKNKKEKARYIELPEFWKFVIDESFFSEKSSSERKYLGLLIVEKVFNLTPPHMIHVVASKNFIRCLINQTADSERNLHKISHRLLSSITQVCDEQPEKTVPTLEALLFGENGTVNFDRLTKSKTINCLITNKSLTSSHISALVNMLVDKSVKEKDISVQRFLLDTMLHVVRAHKSKADKEWTKDVLKHIVLLSFFKKSASADHNSDTLSVSDGFELVARERMYSILAELIVVKNDFSYSESWPYIALEILTREQRSSELLNEMDDELQSIIERALLELNKISKTLSKASEAQLHGLELLFSTTILQIYSGDTESVSVLEDLVSFVESFGDSGEEITLVGLTEILLSLASQKKALLKKLSLQVWELFCDRISASELKVLLDVLSARENKEGFAALFEADDEGDDSEMEEVIEGGVDEGAILNDDHKSEGSDSEGSDGSGSEESNYSDDNVEKIDKEATTALAKALNLPDTIFDDKGEVQLEDLSDSEDESDTSETSLDDKKMMELDDQLSEIFKRRKEALSAISTGNKRKQEVQESRENVIAFKHRVVDMVEVYIKYAETRMKDDKEGNSLVLNNVLSTLVPLLSCLRITLDRALAEKISKVVKNRICKLKGNSLKGLAPKETEEQIFFLLTKIHDLMLASKGGQFHTLYFSVSSATSLFLSKLVVEISTDGDAYTKLIDIYQNTLKQWFTKGKFGVTVFSDFLNWLAIKKQS